MDVSQVFMLPLNCSAYCLSRIVLGELWNSPAVGQDGSSWCLQLVFAYAAHSHPSAYGCF